ncbi:MAG TPA: NAD(P)/FAD-dependent oxidoreductase [Terriglobia bacterium]|nr:NAD(P)/FAD-dependent oxidoreductase [Terriglobia bacterium]
MRIAVIGGGPAGSWASIQLAKRGHSVTLIDSLAPWEKPCGGGITTKALDRFGIFKSDLPRVDIEKITVFFGDSDLVSFAPQSALSVVSRQELGKYLLSEVNASGVRLVSDRVTKIQERASGWDITGRETEHQADFLVGADGATSMVRKAVGRPLESDDLCVTLGYFIPGTFPAHMKIFFVPSFEGYIWSFPRPDHISYGLITRSGPAWNARAKTLLANFIEADLGSLVMDQATFYSAPVPCLGTKSWKNNVISGNRWALVGDAAGFVDPITGEGIYSAFRSAEILAETIEHPGGYARTIANDIGRELARASEMYKTFYNGRFLGGDFRRRTIQLARRSRTVRTVLGNLIAGNQSYVTLKKKLFYSIPSVGWDLVASRK